MFRSGSATHLMCDLGLSYFSGKAMAFLRRISEVRSKFRLRIYLGHIQSLGFSMLLTGLVKRAKDWEWL